MSEFENIAHTNTEKYLPENAEELFHHTVDKITAKKLVAGYLKVMDFVGCHLPDDNRCVDIGCGVGSITQEFRNNALNIHGVLSNLIDSLRLGGFIMLSASRHSYPHCTDFDLFNENTRTRPARS